MQNVCRAWLLILLLGAALLLHLHLTLPRGYTIEELIGPTEFLI